MIEESAIQPCTCPHPAQDNFHGKGMRVMNPKKNGSVQCTVCLRMHDRTHTPKGGYDPSVTVP
jgi:hypothetical protein